MIPFRDYVRTSVLLLMLVLLLGRSSMGQEHPPELPDTLAQHPDSEHEFHRNHFGGFAGVSFKENSNAAATLGLEYARVFSHRWALVGYLELVSSELERDLVLLVGPVYYPMRGLGVILAIGIESADVQVEAHGTTETESELDVLIRGGVAYGFQITETASLGPALYVDQAGGRWTTVLGLAMAVGF